MTDETAVWYIKDTATDRRVRFTGQKLCRAYYHADPLEYRRWVCLSIYQISSDIQPIRMKFRGESPVEKNMIAEAKKYEGSYVLSVKDHRDENEYEVFKFVSQADFCTEAEIFFEPYILLTPRFETIRSFYNKV